MKKLKIAGALFVIMLASGCFTSNLYKLDDVYFRLSYDERTKTFRVINESIGKLVEERQGKPGPLYDLINHKGKDYGEDIIVMGGSSGGEGGYD